MRILLCLVLGLSASLASAAERPKVLEPTTQWDVDYAQNNCRLLRVFGSGKDAVKLVFEQVAPRAPITVILIGNIRAETDNNVLAFEPLRGVQISGGQALDAAASHDRVAFWPRSLGRGRWGLIAAADLARMRRADPIAADKSASVPSNLSTPPMSWKRHLWRVESPEEWQAEDAAFNARAEQITDLVFNPGQFRSVSLHTGGLAKPFQALEQCASDSLKDWGIDPAVEATIAIGAHPIEDPRDLFDETDYPPAALQASKEDNLEVWLNVDAQGTITSCRVISNFASPEINDAICAMVRRKERFVPARTKNGTAVPDFYTQNFVFKMG